MALPINHHRKSNRLKGYDYSQAGGYYVTIVTQGRSCVFGEICNDEMILNEAGKMVPRWWNKIPDKFPSVTVDAFVIMLNHFHGIIFIHETTVGADLCVGPDDMENHDAMQKGEHVGSPLRNMGRPPTLGTPRPNAPLSQIVQWFKTMTTNEYIRGVKQSQWSPFFGKLWQ